MTYWMWLAALSGVFFVLERLAPRAKGQRVLRPGIATDLVYVVLNGHWLGVAIALAADPVASALDGWLEARGATIHLRLASGLPWWAQLGIAFVGVDLVQWGIHNLLHRVPALWSIHQVHHSIREMDFWGSMRFHFLEAVVYKSLQYVPLAVLGFEPSVLFALAVISTAIGHFNHANLRVRMGRLKYLLNGPEMHVWHHAHPSAGPTNVNFGINLSLWDWIFGTAYLPASGEPPAELGFDRIESFPGDPIRQAVWPLARPRGPRAARERRALVAR
jgi:sterol desaturase/sphingolipid hydroxylase (fatty acid hydroxylase superfamily)